MKAFMESCVDFVLIVIEMLSPLLAFLAFIAVVGGIFVAIGVGFYSWADPRYCEATAQAMKVRREWHFWSGCLLEIDGRLEPADWQKSVRVH